MIDSVWMEPRYHLPTVYRQLAHLTVVALCLIFALVIISLGIIGLSVKVFAIENVLKGLSNE
ncbi:hypothetical protein [Caldalkalibacillus thermarum]|uniref:hypothetical protein n=1 Tax=Caldalkalibacillus thermarum TaxID=296745 RepID=UPI0005B2C960|nr:hypothetical protein [Caldalkalibacillus thermarum]GGK12221.1 hypothetical protein GCM10010965_01500 [Caldalkalibacillus thermarum]